VRLRHSPSQHVALLGLLEDKDELVDAVDLILDALYERSKSVGDVVDEGVRDPVRGDANVIFELLDPPADVLRVWGRAEVELDADLNEHICMKAVGVTYG
jgi:hypothetical protein